MSEEQVPGQFEATHPEKSREAVSQLPVIFGIIAIIFAVSVVVGVLIGLADPAMNEYLQKKSVMEESEVETQLVVQHEEDQIPEMMPPFIFTEVRSGMQPVVNFIVDRESGSEQPIEFGSANLEIYAVPQIGYDGRIFLRDAAFDGPQTPLRPYVFHLNTPEQPPARVEFADELPFWHEATVLSPDQRLIAAAYDNPLDPEGVVRKTVVIWNLMTGEGQTVLTVGDDEYLSRHNGQNVFGGASGFSMEWLNLGCIAVTVFEDNASATDPDEKVANRIETACLAK